MVSDCEPQLTEEAVHTYAFVQGTSDLSHVALDVQSEFTLSLIDRELLDEAFQKVSTRAVICQQEYEATVVLCLYVLARHGLADVSTQDFLDFDYRSEAYHPCTYPVRYISF